MPATVIKSEKINMHRVIIGMDWWAVRDALMKKALEVAPDMDPNCDVKIELKQETEGSPAYATSRWTATVTLTKDNNQTKESA